MLNIEGKKHIQKFQKFINSQQLITFLKIIIVFKNVNLSNN